MAETNVATQIARIQTDRNKIRTKLVELGMAETTSNLDVLATAIEGLENRGAVSATVQEGDTYTIPKGYHNGSGTVSGVAGGGNYSLQSKTVTPTKAQQNVTPDSGYYGLSDVTVSAIPSNYQDVSATTATTTDVLTGKIFTSADGKVTTGTMTNNGTISKTLDTTTTSYTVPKGYHSGSGTVNISTETKEATPTKSTQTISPTSGKVLSKVTVNPIPADYITTTDATAIAENILKDKTAYIKGVKTTGTMTNNGAVTQVLDTETTEYTIPKGYHDGSGTVSIELEYKVRTPNKTTQTVEASQGKVLASVQVKPIPDNYVNVASTTANQSHVLTGKSAGFYSSETGVGEVLFGQMPDNGATNKTIDGLTTTSVTIPLGYTSGGTVSLTKDIENALASI